MKRVASNALWCFVSASVVVVVPLLSCTTTATAPSTDKPRPRPPKTYSLSDEQSAICQAAQRKAEEMGLKNALGLIVEENGRISYVTGLLGVEVDKRGTVTRTFFNVGDLVFNVGDREFIWSDAVLSKGEGMVIRADGYEKLPVVLRAPE